MTKKKINDGGPAYPWWYCFSVVLIEAVVLIAILFPSLFYAPRDVVPLRRAAWSGEGRDTGVDAMTLDTQSISTLTIGGLTFSAESSSDVSGEPDYTSNLKIGGLTFSADGKIKWDRDRPLDDTTREILDSFGRTFQSWKKAVCKEVCKESRPFPGGEDYIITDLAGNRRRVGKAPLYKGMTLRDWFASKALQGRLAGESVDYDQLPKPVAEFCYRMADAMIAEREKRP